jgi:hypothetical protein
MTKASGLHVCMQYNEQAALGQRANNGSLQCVRYLHNQVIRSRYR